MTTSPPWQQMPNNLPTNGVAYWVSFSRFFCQPYIAVWIEDTSQWEVDPPLASPYPWYITPFFRAQ